MTEKQTVYLPTYDDADYALFHFNIENWSHVENLKVRTGYFFTPEELNEYTANVIRKALETAAKTRRNGFYDSSKEEKLITDTFNQTYKEFEV